jgi:hypothetical protein
VFPRLLQSVTHAGNEWLARLLEKNHDPSVSLIIRHGKDTEIKKSMFRILENVTMRGLTRMALT